MLDAAPPELLAEDAAPAPAGRRLIALLRPHRWRLATSLLLVAAQVGLGTVPPLVLARIIDVALPQGRTGLLALLCLLMFASAVLASGLALGLSALINTVGQDVVHRLRMLVYGRVQQQPLTFFTAHPIAEVEARVISDVGGLSSALTLSAPSVLAGVVQLAASLVAMVALDWGLALVSLVLAAGLAVLVDRAGRGQRRLATRLQESTTELVKAMSEDLSPAGIVLGRTMRRVDWQRQRFARASRRVASLTARQRRAGAGVRLGVGAAYAALPPVLYLLAGLGGAGVSLGTVVALSTLQARLSAPLQQLLGIGATVASSAAMFQRTFDYIDLRPEFCLDEGVAAPRHGPGVLSVRTVTFQYPGEGRAAVDGVSLAFPPGGLTVLAGPTGSGKSTLALLLAGQLVPGSGSIEVDGVPAAPEQLWRHVTLMPQETVLFNASLRENLLFADPGADDARLVGLLVRSGLGELLRTLPEGLDSPVGERGTALSGGERQRVGLCRALLSSSPVLVADESTSAVDNETAEVLFDLLRAETARRTVVLVAHRIPRLGPHDRVVVLAGGRVVEQGEHAALIDAAGSYADLVALQSAGEPQPVGPFPLPRRGRRWW